jgi:prophage antirepressor-like protein
MTRQASEKEHVMSFEEMAENAKSPSLPTEFKFDESPVRIVMKGDQPWFVAKDLCEILDHSNHRMAVSALDDDEKGVSTADTLAGLRRP